jgi:hypothetical protein
MAKATYYPYTLTAPAILIFPNLDQPKRAKRGGREVGEPRYGGSFILDPAGQDFTAIRALWNKMCKEKWPNADTAFLKALKLPRTIGEEEIDKAKKNNKDAGREDNLKLFEAMAGHVVIKAASNLSNQPSLSVLESKKIVPCREVTAQLVKNKFYAGARVYAEFSFTAYDRIEDSGKDGIACYLNQVLSTGEGERFFVGGARSAQEAFAGVVGHQTDENPLDDDIPF